MVRAERLVLILRRLSDRGGVTLAELVEDTGAGESTIIDDMRQLSAALDLELERDGARWVGWRWSRAWLERQLAARQPTTE